MNGNCAHDWEYDTKPIGGFINAYCRYCETEKLFRVREADIYIREVER